MFIIYIVVYICGMKSDSNKVKVDQEVLEKVLKMNCSGLRESVFASTCIEDYLWLLSKKIMIEKATLKDDEQ